MRGAVGCTKPIGEPLRRFLSLCAETGLPLAPSPLIDGEWHRVLADAKGYKDWCLNNYGVVVHHLEKAPVARSQYDMTVSLLTERHGRLDPAVWPHPVTLSASDLRCLGKARHI